MNVRRIVGIIAVVLSFQLGPGASAAGQGVISDDQGFLRVEGKRFFPIGAYDPPQGWGPTEMAAAGFSLTRMKADRKAWDEAQAAGLRVWFSFGDGLAFGATDADAKTKALAQRVKTLADHPALLFWETADEPAWTDADPAKARLTAEALTLGYKELHRLDPLHPVYLNHAPRNMVETLQRYNSACDIVSVDIYPIIPPGLRPMYAITADGRQGDLPNQTASCVGEYVQKMRRVAGPGRPVFVALQGFAWETLRKEAERDPKATRYPTYAETRFMAFDAILNGANGIVYWGLRYAPAGHPFIEDVARVTRELRDLAPAIIGQTVPHEIERRYHEMGSTIASGVEVLVRERPDGRRVLFTANTSVDPARATFSRLPMRGKTLRSRESGSSVALDGGRFTADYAGLEVRIFEEQ
jgi:hypothetical protein